MVKLSSRKWKYLIVLSNFLLLLPSISIATSAVDSPAYNINTTPGIAQTNFDAMNESGFDLYLDTTVNGKSYKVISFKKKNGELWSEADTFRRLGFILPASSPDFISLNSFIGLKVQFDEVRQTLDIIAPLSMLSLNTSLLNATNKESPRASTSSGFLINYNLFGTQDFVGDTGLSAYTEFRAFNSWGVLSSTELNNFSNQNNIGSSGSSVRLDTTYSRSWPDSLLTLNVGDTLSSATDWSRSTHMAAIQLSSNFNLQPYMVTTPIPQLLGTAALPSSVQLYIDGINQYTGKVPAGPFQINAVPNISGAGNAQLVLTDSLGQSSTISFPLYGTQELLKQGLSDWSVELGVVRENYGLVSNEYGNSPALSATWKYGVDNNWTVNFHGETTQSLFNGGVGSAVLIDKDLGVISGSIAASQNNGVTGKQVNLGYNWRDDRWNFSISGTKTFGNYEDIADLYGSLIPHVSGIVSAGYSTNFLGSFGLSYLDLSYSNQTPSRYAGFYWSKNFGRRSSLSLNVNQSLVNSKNQSIYLGYTLSLDHNTLISSNIQRNNSNTTVGVEASQQTPQSGGFGWMVNANEGGTVQGGQAELDYLGNTVRLDVGIQKIGNDNFAYAGATGAILFMQGEPFFARQISDGFALVSTSGMPNVPVLLENEVIGKTNSNGYLLVTPLNSYQNNLIAINTLGLPANVKIENTEQMAVPESRAGTLVNFKIKKITAASVILLDTNKKPIELGSDVTLENNSDPSVIVGFDGIVYINHLNPENILIVKTATKTCKVHVSYPVSTKNIPTLGPYICK